MIAERNPVPKVIALVILTIGLTAMMIHYDASQLAKLDSMSAADVVQHQRELHQHSVLFHFFMTLILGGFYLGVVEFIAYVVGLLSRNLKPDSSNGS